MQAVTENKFLMIQAMGPSLVLDSLKKTTWFLMQPYKIRESQLNEYPKPTNTQCLRVKACLWFLLYNVLNNPIAVMKMATKIKVM